MTFLLRTLIFFPIVLLLIGRAYNVNAGERTRTYVVIVANNHSNDTGLVSLRFADDDGAKYFELFRSAGAEVALMAVLDPDAQKRFPIAAQSATPPKRADVLFNINRFFRKIEVDKISGITTHFVFIYSGHGSMGPNQEAYINFSDSKFGRSELYKHILAKSPASFNHLIIDACNSYYFVNKRGAKAEREGNYKALVHNFMQTEELTSYPNTGVILAASSESETHEWGRWESGIFSHELRSALLGSADVNGDKKVTYSEAAACVEAANSAIDVPKARLNVFYREPPADNSVSLMDLTELRSNVAVDIAPDNAGRYHVEDSRGVRVADFHTSAEQSISIFLVGNEPFFLRTNRTEATIPIGVRNATPDSLKFGAPSAESRGSVEMSFRRHLYEVPYGIGFYKGTLITRSEERSLPTNSMDERRTRPIEETAIPDDQKNKLGGLVPWGFITVGTGLLLGASGGLFYYLADKNHGNYLKTEDPQQSANYKSTSENYLLTSRILVGTSAAFVLTGTILFIVNAAGRKKEAGLVAEPSLIRTHGGFIIGLGARFP
ncbi:MAG: hypothetical protein GY854_26705 [Deltaproteobacteria bacterium]|nr:hypothetical protein [Deltaproteobacteria bacterium]